MGAVDAAEVVCAARVGAKKAAGRHWREYLGAAWERADREAARGHRGGELVNAAVWGVLDAARDRRKCRPSLSDDLDSRHAPTPAEDRVAALWEATRPIRRPFPVRVRVVLYLVAVEGWTQDEVAEALLVHKTRVSQMLREFFAATGGSPR